MDSPVLHPWNVTPEQAVTIQERLREQILLSWDDRNIRTVAGVDLALIAGAAKAAIVVLGYPDLSPIERSVASVPLTFPYVPGLLAFREGPAILAAWRRLRHKPDLVLLDGHGLAHPRRLGIAAHLGLWFQQPSIGIAKSRLCGWHEPPGVERGERSELLEESDPSQVIGMVVRSRSGVRPVFVSPGHLIDMEHAVEFVLRCSPRYRLPEPIRWAHKVAGGGELPI